MKTLFFAALLAACVPPPPDDGHHGAIGQDCDGPIPAAVDANADYLRYADGCGGPGWPLCPDGHVCISDDECICGVCTDCSVQKCSLTLSRCAKCGPGPC